MRLESITVIACLIAAVVFTTRPACAYPLPATLAAIPLQLFPQS
jgi:hypothetical protein